MSSRILEQQVIDGQAGTVTPSFVLANGNSYDPGKVETRVTRRLEDGSLVVIEDWTTIPGWVTGVGILVKAAYTTLNDPAVADVHSMEIVGNRGSESQDPYVLKLSVRPRTKHR